MKQEQVGGVTFLTPETKADVAKLEKMAQQGKVDSGLPHPKPKKKR